MIHNLILRFLRYILLRTIPRAASIIYECWWFCRRTSKFRIKLIFSIWEKKPHLSTSVGCESYLHQFPGAKRRISWFSLIACWARPGSWCSGTQSRYFWDQSKTLLSLKFVSVKNFVFLTKHGSSKYVICFSSFQRIRRRKKRCRTGMSVGYHWIFRHQKLMITSMDSVENTNLVPELLVAGCASVRHGTCVDATVN